MNVRSLASSVHSTPPYVQRIEAWRTSLSDVQDLPDSHVSRPKSLMLKKRRTQAHPAPAHSPVAPKGHAIRLLSGVVTAVPKLALTWLVCGAALSMAGGIGGFAAVVMARLDWDPVTSRARRQDVTRRDRFETCCIFAVGIPLATVVGVLGGFIVGCTMGLIHDYQAIWDNALSGPWRGLIKGRDQGAPWELHSENSDVPTLALE